MGAGMIVMGSRRQGRIRRALMGSVCESVVRHAPCPSGNTWPAYSSRMEVDHVKLKELRLDRGLSQEELHCMTGVSRDSISKLETGQRPNPHPKTLRRLAEGLGVTVASIRK